MLSQIGKLTVVFVRSRTLSKQRDIGLVVELSYATCDAQCLVSRTHRTGEQSLATGSCRSDATFDKLPGWLYSQSPGLVRSVEQVRFLQVGELAHICRFNDEATCLVTQSIRSSCSGHLDLPKPLSRGMP
jgi:hypothetical protein